MSNPRGPDGTIRAEMADGSVTIPLFNNESTIRPCLEAVKTELPDNVELIVVDDASTDDSSAIAKSAGAKVLTMPARSGPAAARNAGVEASSGDVVIFIDADVVVRPDTVSRMLELLKKNPDVTAVFGSYDNEPAEPNFLSQYRNLLHHFVHQCGHRDASTFWAGCGAVRRQSFLDAGGFDAVRYPFSSIEDIELGKRLIDHGGRIILDHAIQVRHLKRWTLWNMLKTDLLRRALPWSRLIAETRHSPVDLNLRWRDRAAGWIMVIGLAVAIAGPCLRPSWWWLLMIPMVTVLMVIVNGPLYRFFARVRGIAFAIRTIPLQMFHYLSSALIYGWVVTTHRLRVGLH